jgi:non-heme chloroperoxidase
MPYVTTTGTNQTELYYEDLGKGKPVVLIHGWPLSHRMWETQINGLVDAGYRCIAYDKRGFGDSGKPAAGYDYDAFASDLNDLINQLDLRDVTLGGYSMGGGEVARYIGRYGTDRISKAMLICSVTPFMLKTADNPVGIDRSVVEGMIAGAKADRVSFLANFFPAFYNYDADAKDANPDLIPFSKWIAWGASHIAIQECITAFGTTDFRDDLKKFNVPTIVIHGDSDRIVPFDISSKIAHEMIPGSRLEMVAGGSHGFAATHAQKLTELMLDFLKS